MCTAATKGAIEIGHGLVEWGKLAGGPKHGFLARSERKIVRNCGVVADAGAAEGCAAQGLDDLTAEGMV